MSIAMGSFEVPELCGKTEQVILENHELCCLSDLSKCHCVSRVHALSIQSFRVVSSRYIDNSLVASAGRTASMKYSHFTFLSKLASLVMV